MDTNNKYKLIGNAQQRSDNIQQHADNYKQLAKSIKEDPQQLMESATQVLAGLKALMSSGKPLSQVGLSPASLAGVVAGLRVLTRALPKMTDPAKKLRALKVLGDLKVGDKMSLGAATAIANLADKDPEADKLRAAFDQYGQSNQPNPAIIQLLGQLQGEVDAAMRTVQDASSQEKTQGTAGQAKVPGTPAASTLQPAAQAVGTPQPSVVSGGISSTGSQGR